MDFFLPGMIHIDGVCGRYPAISLTGKSCPLNCVHCMGTLLDNMVDCSTPEKLLSKLQEYEAQNMAGFFSPAGAIEGRMPWDKFLPTLANLDTKLFISAHGGMNVDKETAAALKDSAIKQVLVDVTVDEEAITNVFRLTDKKILTDTVENLVKFGPKIAPHVIVGINHGKIKCEYESLDFLASLDNSSVIIVIIMPINKEFIAPPVDEVVDVFRHAKGLFKSVGLGCAKPRGKYRHDLEQKLISEGLIDKLAVWSDKAIEAAKKSGKNIDYHHTCCSMCVENK